MPQPKYRERIYRHYVDAATQSLAPDTLAGLAPRRPYLERLVARHFPAAKDAAVLDLGCGHGALIHVAREAGYTDLLGIDNSPAQVAAAKRLGIHGVHHGDLFEAIRSLPRDEPRRGRRLRCDRAFHQGRADRARPTRSSACSSLAAAGSCMCPNGVSLFAGASRYGDLTHELSFTCEFLTQLTLASGFRSAAFFEDEPIAHGLKSAVRLVLWKMMRALLRFYLTVETGAAQPVLTQNMLAVAIK